MEVVKEEIVEEEIDGRTVEGKIQARLQKLEEAQEKILETLSEHGKKIDDCSIRR